MSDSSHWLEGVLGCASELGKHASVFKDQHLRSPPRGALAFLSQGLA